MRTASTLAAAAFSLASFAPERALDESVEPPPRFVLEIGGQSVEVTANLEFELEVDGKVVSVLLKPQPTRTLVLGELSFEYPEGMSFEYEKSYGSEIWTLDGNDVVVMLHRLEVGMTADELGEMFASGVRDIFPDSEVGQDAQLQVGGQTLTGRTIDWTTSDIRNHQEIFVLESSGESQHVLVLQEVFDEADDHEEMQRVRGLIESTFAWKTDKK